MTACIARVAAEQVDRDHALEVGVGLVGNRGTRRDAGGVDQHVDPAELYEGPRDEDVDILAAGDVGRDDERRDAAVRDVRRNCVE